MHRTRLGGWMVAGVFVIAVAATGVLTGCGSDEVHQSSETAVADGAYTCPMHPEVKQKEPGSCPICGMNLVRVEKQDGDVVGGRAPIRVSAVQKGMMGVRVTTAEKRELETIIRAYGRVAYDPDLYNAQQDYLSTVRAYASSTAAGKASGIKAAETRLALLGMSEDRIKRLRKRGTVDSRLLHGSKHGKSLIYADIFESDISMVHPGMKVYALAPSSRSIRFEGQVSSLDPVLNPKTRSLRAHIEIKDPKGLLRPGMFLNVRIRVPLGEVLAIPTTAVLYTGDMSLVFVETATGGYQPTEVMIASETRDWFAIAEGLTEGQVVVYDGMFLVDSESQLRAAAWGASYSGQEAQGHQH